MPTDSSFPSPQTPNPAPSPWHDLCPLADLATPGHGGKYVNQHGRSLAVFRTDDASGGGGVKVIDDTCPHAGGSLSAGYVQNGVVHCPWHGWPFKIDDGRCPDNPNIKVRCYNARIHEGQVQFQLPTITHP